MYARMKIAIYERQPTAAKRGLYPKKPIVLRARWVPDVRDYGAADNVPKVHPAAPAIGAQRDRVLNAWNVGILVVCTCDDLPVAWENKNETRDTSTARSVVRSR